MFENQLQKLYQNTYLRLFLSLITYSPNIFVIFIVIHFDHIFKILTRRIINAVNNLFVNQKIIKLFVNSYNQFYNPISLVLS